MGRVSWTVFDDKRYTTALMVGWGVLTCFIFWWLGAFHTHFMTFGPSDRTVFMGLVINDWYSWSALAAFSFVNTAINEFLSASLIPWFTNTIQDHKTHYLNYSQATCIHISNLYCLYGHLMSVFSIFLFFRSALRVHPACFLYAVTTPTPLSRAQSSGLSAHTYDCRCSRDYVDHVLVDARQTG